MKVGPRIDENYITTNISKLLLTIICQLVALIIYIISLNDQHNISEN